MYAVEFRAKIKNGFIEIPREHKDKFQNYVKVIILAEESATQTDMIERLLESPIKLDNFQPLSRDEIYERS